ncbi:MAG: hypothetical protein AAF899_00340 [Pseudomonadota bacterium]
MSNDESDSFIREVAEEVRQERLSKQLKKYAPFAVAGVIGLVGASAVVAWLDSQRRAEAVANGRLMVEAQDADAATLAGVTSRITGEAALLARFMEARRLAAEGAMEAAADAFYAIANDGATPLRYAELAQLEGARLDARIGNGERAVGIVDSLVIGGGPYRMLALEMRAALRLNTGDMAGAREDLAVILVEAAPDDQTRNRAEALIRVLPAPAGEE